MSHQTQLVMTYPTGAEEWFCSECGYRIIMTWPPKYKKIILDEGNREARHQGGKGGLSMAIQVDLESPPIR